MNVGLPPDFGSQSSQASQVTQDVQLRFQEAPALAWHELVQGIFLNSTATFQALKKAYANPAEIDHPLLRQQALFTIVIIALQVLCGFLFQGKVELSPLFLAFQAMSHLFLWVALAGGIAFAHHIFTRESRYGLLLTLTGASTLPWILLPVVSVLKASMPMLGAFAYALLWLWTSYLFVKSVAVVFDWSNEHVLLALSLPVLAGLWTYLMYFTVIFSLFH